MADEVGVCNRALQRLGAKRITSLTENSKNARACNASYATLRDAEMSAHPWSCAIKRIQLAANTVAPVFNRTNAFTLPADYLRLLPTDPEFVENSLDWQIEDGNIITNDDAPLNVRYVYRLTDVNKMDVLLREVISIRMAMELCEEITQSNTKLSLIGQEYKEKIAEARRKNAIERVAQKPPEDEWITKRA